MADLTRRQLHVHSVLTDSITVATAELNRADGKAGILLGWVGAAVALITTVAGSHRFTAAPAALVWAGDALLAVSAALLLGTVRPNLRPGTGWTRLAGLDAATILREAQHDAAPEAMAQRAGDLARIAYGKYLRLRRAVDLLYVAGAFLVAALLLSN